MLVVVIDVDIVAELSIMEGLSETDLLPVVGLHRLIYHKELFTINTYLS